MLFKNEIQLICLFCLVSVAKAQNIQDTIHLESIPVFATSTDVKDQTFQSGKKADSIDSLILKTLCVNSLGDVLNYQSSVFVKNYAPGSISSMSARGGNAQQTMVLWNGINIAHPMLGQSDVSQWNAGLFDAVQIEYGASSSLWGSGAINGAVQLNNTFDKQNHIQLSYRYGNFSTHQGLVKTYFNVSKIKTYVNSYWNQSDNNYIINDTLHLKNASYTNKGISGGIQLHINKHQKIQAHSWYHNGFRNLPNHYFNNLYAAQQYDETFRNVIDYLYSKNNWKVGIKLAYLFDKINYTDSVTRIFSRSSIHSFHTEEIIHKELKSHLQMMIGHQLIYNYAITNNYAKNQELVRHAVFMGISKRYKHINLNAIVRKEWTNIRTAIPFTGNIGAEYRLNSMLALKAQSSFFYRLPTLNDLYWKNSGDVHLAPEKGYHYEGGIVLKLVLTKLHSEIVSELTAFNKITNDWIIWLPGGSGQPVPANIAQVWSRGTETNSYYLLHLKKGKIKWTVNSAYILSTTEKSKINNDASIGKQLIYTPRYNINSSWQLIVKNFYTVYLFQYVGYRFISSDNLQWLNPYSVNNIITGYHFNFKKFSLNISFGINNLFNQKYMIIAQRPMLGRNYFIQVQFNTRTTKSN